MTNVNDTEADLELTLGSTNRWKNSNTAAGVGVGVGAGANANSRSGMMLVGSDPLAELVWSPRTGLNIKFAEKTPCFMLEVGPSDMGFLQLEDTQTEKQVSEGHSVASQAARISGEVVKSSSYTGPQNQGEAHQISKRLFEDGMTSGVNGPGSESGSPLKIEAMAQYKPQDHVEMDNGEMEKDGCYSVPFHENIQVGIFENEKIAERCDSVPGEDEERSVYHQENDETHEAESHGSIESFQSANLLTKGKRSSSFEQELVLGSKRIKKQAHDYTVKRDSSFVSWISNMLKGLKNHENYDKRISVCNETRTVECKKMGFQNVFKSLFSPETISRIESKSIGNSKEAIFANNCSNGSPDCLEIKEKMVKHISLYEKVTKEAPKGMFDTIRRLRLSRTDILKLSNSQLSVAHLDGFFLRLRVAKWKEGLGGSRYYVACITGLQGENPWKGLNQPIRVKVGGVECFVESQYVSNCDFLEDELVAWWEKTSQNGGIPVVKDLKLKLGERRALGL
ncbi:Plus-3 [Artemisia annua]|uniref:Plus-3 n=1 Tax=Artemisia annua TaxID=35608 RepID=A0A2U1M891_ARTAN|nr:Plus-3 [Artemisia annua]